MQHCTVNSSQSHKTSKRNSIHIGKKEAELALLTGNMILTCRKSKDSQKTTGASKLIQQICEIQEQHTKISCVSIQQQ